MHTKSSQDFHHSVTETILSLCLHTAIVHLFQDTDNKGILVKFMIRINSPSSFMTQVQKSALVTIFFIYLPADCDYL